MPKYRIKPSTVEASQWWAHGDHPAVQPLPDDYRFVPDLYGWLPAQYGGAVVSRGDWIVTAEDGSVRCFRPEEFAAMFEPLKE